MASVASASRLASGMRTCPDFCAEVHPDASAALGGARRERTVALTAPRGVDTDRRWTARPGVSSCDPVDQDIADCIELLAEDDRLPLAFRCSVQPVRPILLAAVFVGQMHPEGGEQDSSLGALDAAARTACLCACGSPRVPVPRDGAEAMPCRMRRNSSSMLTASPGSFTRSVNLPVRVSCRFR